jgi:uncharacterized surface protein with fasciclin (FAS1) repeats
MRSIMLLSLFVMILVLAACGPNTAMPQDAEPVLAPTETTAVQVEPTAESTPTAEPTLEPTSAPTDEPTPEPSPTSEPITASHAPSSEELKDKDYITNVLQADAELAPFSFEILFTAKLLFELDGSKPYTIFAPVYKPEDLPGGLSAEAFLSAIKGHIVPGLYVEADFLAMDGQSLETLSEDQSIQISVKEGVVYLNDMAMITEADILANNGIIHKIDKFILP